MTDHITIASGKSGIAWSCALAFVALAGTLLSACMMPFVAIAVATAATMTRAQAAVTIGGIWAINQVLGFGMLGYPFTAYAVSWGVAMGVASMVAMLVAALVLGGGRLFGLRLLAAFAVAFAVYEGGLFGFAQVAGGAATFSGAIVRLILTNDAMWFVGLIALHAVLTRAAPKLFGSSMSLRLA